MASRKIQTYQNKAKNLCTISFLCLTWMVNANALKQNIKVIKEICSSLVGSRDWMNRRRFC